MKSSVLLLAALALAPTAGAQNTPGEVLGQSKLSSATFPSALGDQGQLGASIAPIGDLDGNGTPDLAVGAPGDDDGGNSRGAVWIVFLEPDGTSLAAQKISDLEGGFVGQLDDVDRFGASLAPLGDVDGDGTYELAVGTPGDDDGGASRGAFYILSLMTTGEVASFTKVSSSVFGGGIDNQDAFGSSLAAVGDLDGDDVVDLAVGVPGDDDAGLSRGAVWILFLNADLSVKDQQKISDIVGGFSGQLDDFDQFGNSLSPLGDLDGDGFLDLAVGAFGDDDGGPSHGAVWILFLNANGTVDVEQKISSSEGGFEGSLDNGDAFGVAVAATGDIDGNTVGDLAVGVLRDDDGGGPSRGAVWLLYLEQNGTVRGEVKISEVAGGFTGPLADFDQLGSGLAALDDFDGDGNRDLAVGAPGDDDGGVDRGAVYSLFLDGAFQATFLDVPSSNVSCMTPSGQPRIGSNWILVVAGMAGETTYLIGVRDLLATPIVFPFGELVIDVTSPTFFIDVSTTMIHTLSVPNDPGLAGRQIFIQAVKGGPPVLLGNAIEVIVGF